MAREARVAATGNRRRADREEVLARRALLLRRATLAGLATLALGATAAAGFGLHRWLTRGELWRIGEVRFTGLQRASRDELLALSPVQPGDNLFAADLGALEKALARQPWVRAVEARRTLPPALEVEVKEREPAALVQLGELYLVDREGLVFKRALPGDGLDLPLVTGFGRDDYVQRKEEVDPALAGALALLESYAGEELAGKWPLSEVHVDPDHGVTLYVGDEATEVRLGTGDLPEKLQRLKKVLAALGAEGKQAEVLHLDNRSRPSWVTVRLRRGGGGEAPGLHAPSPRR
jgi:cell division protein FtsQ